jgi:hypothetical protein
MTDQPEKPPAGKERTFQQSSSAAIDGAPITYIIVLAAVVTALSFIPLSPVVGSTASFPMSQGIYPLVGWLLGPLAGSLADGIGALISVFVVLGAVAGGFAGGAMLSKGKCRTTWIVAAVSFTILFAAHILRAHFYNKVGWLALLAGTFINWSALLLFLLPTRDLVVRWIGSKNLWQVSSGLFLGTWIGAGLSHLAAGFVYNLVYNMTEAFWWSFTPLAPFENLVRCLVGAVIGSGLIAGMRALGLFKPTKAIY